MHKNMTKDLHSRQPPVKSMIGRKLNLLYTGRMLFHLYDDRKILLVAFVDASQDVFKDR